MRRPCPLDPSRSSTATPPNSLRVVRRVRGHGKALETRWRCVKVRAAAVHAPSRPARYHDHWTGWKHHEGALADPEGNATTQGQLRAYYLVMQLAADLALRDPESSEQYLAILRSA